MTDQLRRDLARLASDEATLRKKKGDAQTEAAKALAAARAKRDQATRTSSRTSASSYLREAERLEKRAGDHERAAADATKRLADVARKQGTTSAALDARLRENQRRRDGEDRQRRDTEKRHATEIARLTRPSVHYVHEVRVVSPPKPEALRVLYLTANPALDLRVDAEVRQVREAVKKALHRDSIVIDHRSAATPEDLLDGINEIRPHVVHFSGHASSGAVVFDHGGVAAADARDVSFEALDRILSATDEPAMLLVLNACDTLEQAEVLLHAVPVVIAMSSSITDLAAAVFAARFYSAIASGQSVAASLSQATVGVELAGLDEAWIPNSLVRDGVELDSLILVRGPA